MPLYVYKCDYCDRVEDKLIFDPEKRKESFPCGVIGQRIYSGITYKLRYENDVRCPGQMIFQPVQKTSFRMQGFEKE